MGSGGERRTAAMRSQGGRESEMAIFLNSDTGAVVFFSGDIGQLGLGVSFVF
ncbi:hypothetical protein TIFTF001_054551 [Ficus carica]|uniref:Uncharacterized protein n=1 Tax=Ficus carica TaxID=3494 RepID=A0AA88JFX0_FICCA|nr:hypothetical protein TIFTF001_054551 [Ficus carica]